MLDVIQQSIAPVDSVRIKVDSESVWPAQQNVSEDHQMSSVEISAANVGRPVPLGVEDEALVGMDNNGPGPFQIAE